ncbi:MAG TPA: hypothetical protein VHU80_12885 [Polyangiaceae bacterium]|jgi:hypothetical protein|nr:hypothetical protein [Polyangiaceae bacterium]
MSGPTYECSGADARGRSKTPPPREKWSRLRRYWVVFRAYRAIVLLERAAATRDLVPRILFATTFFAYFSIGGYIDGHGVFKENNHFFNGDSERAIHDLLPTIRMPSQVISLGHPLLAILVDPFVQAFALVLRGSGNLPVLLACHVAGALAAVLAYLVFRRLDAPRALAAGAAVIYGFSCSELVFGSIAETFAFVALALTASVLVAVRTTNPLANVLVQVTAFGTNAALAPHSLLCAPVLWFPRLRFGRWLRTTLIFVVLLAVTILVLARLQELFYPGTGYFFQRNGAEAYSRWASLPKTKEQILHRGAELASHFFAFCVVAPRPLLTEPPDSITTFMWEQKRLIAHYDVLGAIVASAWCLLLLAATAANVRAFFLGDATTRARILFFAGWLFGTFGLFAYFGDDLLLYSTLWTFHLVAWVVLGLTALGPPLERRAGWFKIAAFSFVALLVLNNGVFVHRMISQH